MKKTTKKPYPAQLRYYKKNPTISFRFPADEKQRLEDIARDIKKRRTTGKSTLNVQYALKKCTSDLTPKYTMT